MAGLRIQSSHDFGARGFDAHFTPIEAVTSLIILESGRIPRRIWEIAAGNGAIVSPLRQAGHTVVASDIFDYGLAGCLVMDTWQRFHRLVSKGSLPTRLIGWPNGFCARRSPKPAMWRCWCAPISSWRVYAVWRSFRLTRGTNSGLCTITSAHSRRFRRLQSTCARCGARERCCGYEDPEHHGDRRGG